MTFHKPAAFVDLHSRGELPHLHTPGCSFFITFRLRDAVESSGHPPALLPADIDVSAVLAMAEPPLCLGSCALASPRLAHIVADALRHFDGRRYTLHAWCVMPNHVHVVATPWHQLSQITHSWKSYTANLLNKELGWEGAFWERESFDHLIRSEQSFERFIHYTEANPVIAGLCSQPGEWMFSSACGR